MKYVYIALIIALIAGGYYVISSSMAKQQQAEAIPDGYHMMEDGTLMRNDAMAGMEGMGSMGEVQEQARQAQLEAEASMNMEIDANAKVFEVRGENFAFDVQEIRVKQGDTVTINFESTDGFHDWVVDEFDARTQQVRPGTPTSVTFVADQAGTFEYYCSVGSHRANGMVGTLVVEGA